MKPNLQLSRWIRLDQNVINWIFQKISIEQEIINDCHNCLEDKMITS